MNTDKILQAKQNNLLDIISKHTRLHRVAANEYAGACPKCGGVDRYRVHIERGWFCRQCTGEPGSGGHWLDVIDFIRWYYGCTFQQAIIRLVSNASVTPDELARIAEEREKAENDRREKESQEMAAARAELQAGGAHHRYHAILLRYPAAMAEWHARGIAAEWIAYYELGYCPERNSLTIPYWRFDVKTCKWYIIGLRHRLLQPTDGGKYRPEIPGLGNHLFYTDPMTSRFFGRVLLVEGEIKAMVTWAALWRDDGELIAPDLWVIGMPGKSWKPEYLDALKDADEIIICLDPDARKDADRLAITIGPRAKILQLPDKIDDLITAGIIDGFDLIDMLDDPIHTGAVLDCDPAQIVI